MRDQEIDLACLVEEENVRPMRLRYGVTAAEASHHEPLEVSLNQEEVDLSVDADRTWEDAEPENWGVATTHSSGLPDDLDEQQVAPAAEHDAMHVMND